VRRAPRAARVEAAARRRRTVVAAVAGITRGAAAATEAAVAIVVVGAPDLALATADAASPGRAPAIVSAVTAAAAIVALPLADAADLARPCQTGSVTKEIAMRRRKAPVSASSISLMIRARKIWKRSLADTDR